MTVEQSRGDAKQRAAQAIRGMRKTTNLPRPLQFLTGAALLEFREPAKRRWEDVA